jgi:cytochrome c biogenesis protein CcdA/thiol-disulfide isomerase/thioredoxin
MLVLVTVLFASSAGPALASSGDLAVQGQDGVVRLVLFWSQNCPHCHYVISNVLPPLEDKYGEQLETTMVETSSDPPNYELYLAAVELFEVPPNRQGVPALFIGDIHLVGSREIPDELDNLIQRYLDQGGIDYPPVPGLDAITGEPSSVETTVTKPPESEPTATEPPQTEANPIYLAYFYQTGCQDCDRVKGDLGYLQAKYPQLIVEEYNVRDHAELAEWLGQRAGVPESRRLTAPTVFIGDGYLLEEQLDARSLGALLKVYEPGGAERVWEDWQESAGESAQQGIVERFKSLGVLTVVLAGLVDGLNPCAFATLVFFVSYLTLSGRKGRDILITGAAFTLGVFLAYVAVGLGMYKVLDLLSGLLTTLGRWVYGLTALFCAGLAVFSFADYLKARRGDIADMTLNLPHKLRMRINAVIRQGRNARAFVAGAFLTGLAVSFLELACTGQVYLPTIMFVMSQPGLRVRALAYLVLYNVLFIVPLAVVFVLAYYGTGSKQLTCFLQRRAAVVKLAMALLFASLAGWLTFTMVA